LISGMLTLKDGSSFSLISLQVQPASASIIAVERIATLYMPIENTRDVPFAGRAI
jgi:hypothetical protein